ncbi:MAG: SH3 domain-containing protein [Phormidesmis sp. CAN_BIN44]|nr:SH3 domain-containing protein [Phormidesmis sp. CAN_BIN44]
MENLAYLHLAVDFEDPSPQPTLRSLKELGLSVPNSAWVGVASLAIAISVLASAHNAMAVVSQGSTGSAVTAVQSALRSRGYDLAVDGAYGSRTAYIVSLFQGAERISADGVVGPQTASVLGLSGPAYGSGGGGGGTPGNGSSTGVVTVTTPIGVNIRSGPGTGYAVVGGLGYGARVSTYGSSGGWYRVNSGWILSSYTSVGGSGGSGGGNPGGGGNRTVVAGSGLYIRSGPGTGYGVVGSLGNGASIPTYSYSNGWYQTNSGWVSADYVR